MSKYHQRRGFSFSSCFATLFGVILLPITILGLYYIEEFALSEYLTKEFAKKNYIEASADTIEADKEGKLVLIHGKAATTDILNDDIFNTKVDNSLSLNRKVEMYQWEETKHKYVGAVKFIRREFLGDTRVPGLKYREDVPFSEQLYKKNPSEVFTGIILKHYNYPRIGSLTWQANKEIK